MYTSAMNAQAYVHQAEVVLTEGTDPAAVGATVTVALCGHWDHDGPCRWPHHNQIDGVQFRTVFIATPEDEPEVRRRIRAALHGQPGWRVSSDDGRTLAADEQAVATQLALAPRRL
jgi:pyrimidine deaminase RibD-like protein